MNILEFVLLMICFTPLNSLYFFYVYDAYKKNKILNEQQKKEINSFKKYVVATLLCGFAYQIFSIIFPFRILYYTLFFLIIFIFRIIFTSFYCNSIILEINQKIKACIFDICIMVIAFIGMGVSLAGLYNFLNASIEVPESIYTFANEENLNIFEESELTMTSSDIYGTVYHVNNDSYSFSIYNSKSDDESYVIYMDATNPEVSFRHCFTNCKPYNTELAKIYKSKNPIYYGFNVRSICYLVNENNIYEAVAILDGKRGEFYASEYLIINLETGASIPYCNDKE